MIDLKDLRENPGRYREGAARKGVQLDFDRLLAMDERRRRLQTEQETLRAEQNRLAREMGPQIGRLMGQLKSASGPDKDRLEREAAELKARPAALKEKIQSLEAEMAEIEPAFNELLLRVPLPPDPDVPVGTSASDNVEIRRWNPPPSPAFPAGFDPEKPYETNKGFLPRTHLEIVKELNLADFERGVKMAGSRSYVLKGDGMLLHQAVLRYAFDFMVQRHGFKAMSVPVIVREECMVGTGFFPAGREQTYLIDETRRGAAGAEGETGQEGHDLYLTGTGEVGLMGLHMGEILREEDLPLQYTTVSTCFRREAGAAGKDTAGLYRIHQFDKVEQVVICRADEAESRAWHAKMIGFVEELLQSLELPYRLLQCCTGDLGVKNADMVDIESWMPGRGEIEANGRPRGEYGETHSASRLYDYQCRRLNMRYRPGGEAGKGPTTFCHSLNNTVAASPRILIPILEMYQNADGSVTVPEALRPYMGGRERIG
jgi:seryl-tRNA synthetase